MRRIALLVLMGLGACTAELAAVGKTADGLPVSGQLTGRVVEGKAVLDLNIFSARNGTCSGSATKTKVDAVVTSVPLLCSNGKRGQATITSDYLNQRDTIIYQLSGERGQIVAGLSTQMAM